MNIFGGCKEDCRRRWILNDPRRVGQSVNVAIYNVDLAGGGIK